MKKVRIVSIILILIFLLCSMQTAIYANSKIPTEFYRPDSPTGYTETLKLGNTIISAMRIFGTIIAVVGIMVLGIKYMIGTVEERADYKKTMIPYLIGCIMIFAITTIVSIIYNLVENANL